MVNNDKLDMLIMLSADVLAEKNLELFKSTDTSGVVCSKSLDRRVKRNINKESRRKEYGSLYKYGKNVAAAILIICTVSFGTVMSVEAVRTALWKAIVEFFDDYLAITYVADDNASEKIAEVTEVKHGIEKWEKEVLLDADGMYLAVYRQNGVKMMTYEKSIMNGSDDWMDNESTTVEEVKVGMYDGLLFIRPDDQSMSLSWSDGACIHRIDLFSQDITPDELISWAETVE